MTLTHLDSAVVAVYAGVLLALAIFVSRDRHDHARTSSDYFLAGRNLPWWVVGTSVIAANISAEQIVGMTGSGYVLGLAIAAYEWLAAIGLLIVARFLLPVFLHHRIYTMPQFLGERYNVTVQRVMAVFWLGVYVFVNLTSVLWLGALTIETLTGIGRTMGMLCLALFAAVYSLYGGLRAVAFTDVVQVVVLCVGGSFLSWLLLDRISGGEGAVDGFLLLQESLPEKFDLVLDRSNPGYAQLPGMSVLFGGLWVMIISYFGFNQYIVQRALAAPSLEEARKGLALAALLKLLLPVIVVLPGLAAAYLAPGLALPDMAYPSMIQLMPEGVRGLVFAALVAAIVSSVSSMSNSVATIFTMDIYRSLRSGATERSLVTTGRITALVALVLATASAAPLLGETEQAFQYIQEFTGFLTPGVTVLFLFGMFWPRMNAAGALAAALCSGLLSLLLRLYAADIPFLDRVGLVFLACAAAAVAVSLFTGEENNVRFATPRSSFATSAVFNLFALIVLAAVTLLYAFYW